VDEGGGWTRAEGGRGRRVDEGGPTSMALEVKEAPSLILPPIPHLQLAPFPVEACARIAVQQILRNKQQI
jgi:hypothetical protein